MTIQATKEIYFDVNQAAIVNNTTGSTTDALPAPVFYKNNDYILDITIYEQWDARWDLSGATWKLGIGNIGSTSNPLVEANNASFTTTGAALGELQVSVNVSSATLTADLGTSTVKQYSLEIVADESSTVMQTPVYIRGVVYPD